VEWHSAPSQSGCAGRMGMLRQGSPRYQTNESSGGLEWAGLCVQQAGRLRDTDQGLADHK
jgi:hypothetical protein